MNDIRVSSAIKKYGEDLGHKFDNLSSRCKYCNIPHDEFMRHYPQTGLAGQAVLCSDNPTIINDFSRSKRPKIQKITKDEFWSFLHIFVKMKQRYCYSFKETFEYFWKNHKINRSTFIKLFNEIYHEQKFGTGNTLHCYGAPTGSYSDRDRLPMITNQGDKLWSLWGIDDFNSNPKYEK